MNHAERLELLGALVRSGVSYYKSHDLEIRLGAEPARPGLSGLAAWLPEGPAGEPIPAAPADDAATEKLKDLIDTLKMDDASLVDKIFPAGAGL